MNRRFLTRQGSGLSRSLRDGDFEEEDVWDVLKGRRLDPGKSAEPTSRSVPRSIPPTAARMVPRGSSYGSDGGGGGGGGGSSRSSHDHRAVQRSAPVNIPGWTKFLANNSRRSYKDEGSMLDGDDSDEDDSEHDDDEGTAKNGGKGSEDEEKGGGDEFGDNGKIPPHKFIARRLARSQIPSFSVVEGVGRTLKGRDLSKVRNAVLTKTGFLESL